MDEPLLIVGAGLAGSAAAVVLGKAGHAPLVIERTNSVMEKVCGCFLSVEAAAMLEHLGVELDRLGASHIDRVRLVHGARTVEARLPFPARGVSRKLLDNALVKSAEKAGARLRFGTQVMSIAADSAGGVMVGVRGGETVDARTLFLASGKHDVRDAPRQAAGVPGNIGLKQMFRLTPAQTGALSGSVELYLFAGGYAGLQLVEDGIANLCLVVDGGAFRARGGQWHALLDTLADELPQLGERLVDAEPQSGQPLAISRIPYGFVHRPDAYGHPALFRLGDQAAVIPSFSGDGMAIALHSGMAAAQCVLAGGSSADFHGGLRRQLRRQFRLAVLLNKMAASVYGRSAIMAIGGAAPALMRLSASATRLRAGGPLHSPA